MATIDWKAVEKELDAQGWSVLPVLFREGECNGIAALYDAQDGFRSRVVMARHGFGRGEYRYFAYTLPPIIEALRTALYSISRSDREQLVYKDRD